MWNEPQCFTADAERLEGLRYTVTHLRDLQDFQALREEWEALAAFSQSHSACLSFSYCELAASRLISDGGMVAVIRVYDGHGPCALWPLGIRSVAFVRVAKILSCGTNEEYGEPLVRDGADIAVFGRLARATAAIQADVLWVRFVRSDSIFNRTLAGCPMSWLLPIVPKGLRDNVPGYTIAFRQFETWDEFVATRAKSLLADSRRHLKKLNSRGHAEFGWCKTIEDAESVLTWLFANKRQWAQRRRFHTKFLMRNDVRDFYIALARRTDLTGTPLVTYVKLNGTPVAASVNLIGPLYFEGIVTTFDEALSDCSPGSLMHEFCMKWALSNNRDFDFRAIYSAYKARWASHVTSLSTLTIFLTVRGRLAELSLLRVYALRLTGRFRSYLARRLNARATNRK